MTLGLILLIGGFGCACIGFIAGLSIKIHLAGRVDVRADAAMALESMDEVIALARRNGLATEPIVIDAAADADTLRDALEDSDFQYVAAPAAGVPQ